MRFINPKKLAALIFVALIGVVPPAQALVIYNSFGPGDSFKPDRWAIGGASSDSGYQGHAEFFIPGVSGDLSSIQVAAGTQLTGTRLSNFAIAQDNGSGVPGTVLESFNGVVNIDGVLNINSILQPLLQAGTKYWLVDGPTAANSYNGWCLNNQGIVQSYAVEFSPGNWVGNPRLSSTALPSRAALSGSM